MKLEMPEPTKSDGPPAPLQINTVGWHLNISDLHLPHFDKKVLDQAFREGKRKKIKTILFNGDTLDCHALSRHAKHKKSHDYGYEIDLGDELLQYTRQQFPDARMLWKNGNHEERAAVYLQEKAKELSELKALQLCNMLNFKQHGVEAVEDRRVVRFGKLNVVHGHEFGPGGGVNPARWLFLKSCQVVMCGHFHRTSEHFDRNINDFHNACWSTGCMCDLHPFWNPLNKWNHGFATIELNGRDGGDFHVENHRVIKGEIV